MDKVQKHNSFNINTPSSESYRNYGTWWVPETFSELFYEDKNSCPFRETNPGHPDHIHAPKGAAEKRAIIKTTIISSNTIFTKL
jgi:hypothetical protein